MWIPTVRIVGMRRAQAGRWRSYRKMMAPEPGQIGCRRPSWCHHGTLQPLRQDFRHARERSDARVGTVVYAVRRPEPIAGGGAGRCQQRAWVPVGRWLNRWRPDRCGSGSTSNAPVCRMSPGDLRHQHRRRSAPTAPAEDLSEAARICIAAAPSAILVGTGTVAAASPA